MKAAAAIALLLTACGWNPSRPFDRESPSVNEAVTELDAGDAASAASKLEDYLSTGPCKEGSIGVPDSLRRRADGTFDLGLSLFRVGEQFGRRFGEEEIDAGVDEASRERRHEQIECARRVVQVVAEDDSQSGELRARARYLEGNLAFLDGAYEEAVNAYDRALVLSPAVVDGGDPVSRDAAFNRAIALRRIEDKKDAGADASRDASQDSGPGDSGRNSPHDAADDRPDHGGQDASTGGQDAGRDDSKDAAPQPQSQEPDAGAGQPPPSRDEDQRMLDQLENAPTLQQEQAKRMNKKRVRGMADK